MKGEAAKGQAPVFVPEVAHDVPLDPHSRVVLSIYATAVEDASGQLRINANVSAATRAEIMADARDFIEEFRAETGGRSPVPMLEACLAILACCRKRRGSGGKARPI